MKQDTKIGIIQNAPISGDFSKNLRHIVQGYRYCIDHGASLVIAPAHSLCGSDGKDIEKRDSYIRQSKKALEVLAQELGSIPLILSIYSDELSEIAQQGMADIELLNYQSEPLLCPYLLSNNNIKQLEETQNYSIAQINLSIIIGNEETACENDEQTLLIRLCTEAWHHASIAEQEKSQCWESKFNQISIISVQSAGCREGKIYPGGSSYSNEEGKIITRLPFFQTAHQVISLKSHERSIPLPSNIELLRQALTSSLRSECQQEHFVGICLSWQHPQAPLLAALCGEAMGKENTHALCFCEKDSQQARHMGIDLIHIELGSLCNEIRQLALLDCEFDNDISARIKSNIACSYAEQHRLLLLSPLTRRDILLGQYTSYAESCAQLLPFASLYPSLLRELAEHIAKDQPDLLPTQSSQGKEELDIILHELYDLNSSPARFIHEHKGEIEESSIRYVQRHIQKSANMRYQLPPILQLNDASEEWNYPLYHRLND